MLFYIAMDLDDKWKESRKIIKHNFLHITNKKEPDIYSNIRYEIYPG